MTKRCFAASSWLCSTAPNFTARLSKDRQVQSLLKQSWVLAIAGHERVHKSCSSLADRTRSSTAGLPRAILRLRRQPLRQNRCDRCQVE